MLKVGILVWLILGTTLAGSAVLVVLVVPGLSDEAMKWVPTSAIAGFILAFPLSLIIAKQITAAMQR